MRNPAPVVTSSRIIPPQQTDIPVSVSVRSIHIACDVIWRSGEDLDDRAGWMLAFYKLQAIALVLQDQPSCRTEHEHVCYLRDQAMARARSGVVAI